MSDKDKDILYSKPLERRNFWSSFISAVEAKPYESKVLIGKSGLSHPIITLGTDSKRKRLIVISADADGRSAALTQQDIQAAYPELKVILARPIAINLAKIANDLNDFFGKSRLDQEDIIQLGTSQKIVKQKIERQIGHFFEKSALPVLQALGHASLNTNATWQDVIMQLSHVQFINPNSEEYINQKPPIIEFTSLIGLDPSEIDRQMGVCSIPLYELSIKEAEVFHSGKDIEQVRYILNKHNILQYFFPPPDTLALGFIEKEKNSLSTLKSKIRKSPEIGHPFGPNEILSSDSKLENIIETLKEKGFSIEGELGLELTDKGTSFRQIIKFTPREGLLSKISKILSIKIDFNLKDLFNQS